MIDSQMRCDGCGTARTYTPKISIPGTRCPFCASPSLRKRDLPDHSIDVDQIAPIKISEAQATTTIDNILPKVMKKYQFNTKMIRESLHIPIYIPFWYFDLSIDPDGSGSAKPSYHQTRRNAVLPPLRLITQKLTQANLTFEHFDEHYLQDTPMVMPQISYQDAMKTLLHGVQDDLSARNLPATRASGLIGEIGMVTYLQLIPAWVFTILEHNRLHQILVNGITGNVHVAKPRVR